jgi:signal peptidase I
MTTTAVYAPTAFPMAPRLQSGRFGKLRSAFRLVQTLVTTAALLGILAAAAFFTVPRYLGWQGVIVLSGSMEPTLKVGGLVYIDKHARPESIKVGDIITFDGLANFHGSNITHRVIDISRGEDGALLFHTKGDANQVADQEPVPAANLVGREVFHTAQIGHASNWVRQKSNFYLILWVPAALIIATELLSIAREFGKLRRKRQPAGS